MNLLREVGAVAGLASFVGLALLALLYFAQARDVRRLRENASFLVEGADGQSTAAAPAERTATAVAANEPEPEKAAAAAAATAPNEAEAFRRAELARQAAERRQRFEQRRRKPGRPSIGDRERPAWMSEPRSVAVVAVGAVLLLAGIAFGATRILGGGSETATKGEKQANSPCPPSQTNVAVLNGTATAGLAAQFAAPLKQKGYKTSPVGNTESPVASGTVMFDPATGQACAPIISGIVGIQKTEPMSNEVRAAAEGDPVAVVLGDDQAGETSTTGASSDTTSTGI
jgi:LytR cell envelope-related transcriptional attenuator